MQTEQLSDRLLRLDDLLSAIDDEEALLLGELDGYLCGVLIAPQPIAEDEWLPPIFAEVLPEALPAPDEMAELQQLILERHAEIAGELAVDGYQPLYELDENDGDAVLWEVWIAGFERAMALRLSAWEKLLQSRQESIAQESAILLMDLLSLGAAHSPVAEADAQKLSDDAPDLIPELAGNLYRAHVVALTREPVRTVSVGRNDPCPCGSGLKYKKCHGAA